MSVMMEIKCRLRCGEDFWVETSSWRWFQQREHVGRGVPGKRQNKPKQQHVQSPREKKKLGMFEEVKKGNLVKGSPRGEWQEMG